MRPTFWILLFLLFLWLLGTTYCHSTQCPCGIAAAGGAVVPAAVSDNEETSLKFINISDEEGGYSASMYDNLLFSPSECMYDSPISDSLNIFFQGLADYLVNKETRILVLQGLYQDSETNSCGSDNLGLARAESVRQLLVDQGVPESQIRLAASQQNLLDVAEDKIMGGIAYTFLNGDLNEVESRLRARSISLYFNSNDANIELNKDQTAYFEDLKFYLSRNEDATAKVTGHTDDVGSPSGNRRLSKERAGIVSNYMVSRGINEFQIATRGAGPDEPVATNDTPEGRADNRRVEITIQ